MRKIKAPGLTHFLVPLLFGFLIIPNSNTMAQAMSNYYVYLNGKAPVDQAFISTFHSDALARRAKSGQPFPALDDLPLIQEDCRIVATLVDSVRYQLRWLGAITVRANQEQIARVGQLDFVSHVEPMGCFSAELAEAEDVPADTLKQLRLYKMVREMMALDTLTSMGLSGKGVRIAIFDAGFSGAKEHPAFSHLFPKGKIELSKDFYGGKGEDVYYGSGHGTGVLGCIAGISEYGPLGAAPQANFLLARTEHNHKEKPIEEDHWLAAAEWADQHGADIISSSLGYAKKRYLPSQMDGLTAPVSRAAAAAVRKGILVVNSAGNEGQSQFKRIAAPADADSVLTIGASYPMVEFVMPFSSTGPNARGVTKPDVSAPGYVLSSDKHGGLTMMPGTSFSCPLVAGVAACMMEKYPEKGNMEIRELLVKAGHYYPYFDYALGYGVLDARYLFRPHPIVKPSFAVAIEKDSLVILPDSVILMRKSLDKLNGMPMHIAFVGPQGGLLAYMNRRIGIEEKRVALQIPGTKGFLLRIWWEGYLFEQQF